MENEFKTEQKSGGSKSQTIIIVLLMLALLCAGGYIAYTEFFAKRDSGKPVSTTENKEEPKVEEESINEDLSLDNEIVNKLYKPFTHHRYVANKEELYYKDIVTASDLSNAYRNRLAFAYYFNLVSKGNRNNAYDGKETNKNSFSYSYLLSTTLEKYYKELFGNEITYEPESFDSYNIDLLTMTYNKSELRYETDDAAGDASFYRYSKQLYKAKRLYNTIELYEYVAVLNAKPSNDPIGVYKNIDDANNFRNVIVEIRQEQLAGLYDKEGNVDLMKYKGKLSEYKYTFTKDSNGNYYFTKIEKINK